MSAQAFIAFLRTEANQAEERARQLRATAAAIEANADLGGDGRKKRKREPNKPKRQPTAYTMFVQENYDIIKRANDPNMPGKDVIALIARQWAGTSEEEKQHWKERALAQAHQDLAAAAADDTALEEGVAYGDPEEAKKKSGGRKVKASAAV